MGMYVGGLLCSLHTWGGSIARDSNRVQLVVKKTFQLFFESAETSFTSRR